MARRLKVHFDRHTSRLNGNAAIFETPIGCLAAYMEGHKVSGHALCPASVYLEQAIAGALIVQRYMELDFGRSVPVLRSVEFSRPLVLRPEIRLIVRTHVTIHEDGTGLFSITSRLETSREEHVHVHGDLRFSSVLETASTLALELASVSRHAEALACPGEGTEVFNTHAAYEVVFPRVVEYAKDYHTVRSLTVSEDGASGVASVSLTSSLGAQPVFLDTMLHVAGFMVNLRGDVSDAYICSGVAALEVLRDLVDERQLYTIHCTNDRLSLRNFVTADIVAVHASDPPVVVAQLRGAQFRRVRLTSLHRGLAIVADPDGGARSRMRTNSNAVITPSSSCSTVFERSRSNTLSTVSCANLGLDRDEDVGDAEGVYAGWSGPASQETLVSEGGAFDALAGRIREIMAEVLGITDLCEMRDDADFESLGLDSLGSIEAQQALRVALNRLVPHDVFSQCGTLEALCAFFVDDKPADDGETQEDECWEGEAGDEGLVALQRCSGAHAPLYLVHDGSGLVNAYKRLTAMRCEVWGIGNPRFLEGEWGTLEEMAGAYASGIERHVGGIAPVLGGWSFGGVVAFEIAQILVRRGIQVKGVVLIDSPAPSAAPLLTDALIERVLQDQDPDQGVKAVEPTALVARQFRQNTALLAGYTPGPLRDAEKARIPHAFLRCKAGYAPEDVEVAAWFRERGDVVGPWEALVGERIPVWDVPGHHFEPFSGTQIKETSVQLDRACRYLDTL